MIQNSPHIMYYLYTRVQLCHVFRSSALSPIPTTMTILLTQTSEPTLPSSSWQRTLSGLTLSARSACPGLMRLSPRRVLSSRGGGRRRRWWKFRVKLTHDDFRNTGPAKKGGRPSKVNTQLIGSACFLV